MLVVRTNCACAVPSALESSSPGSHHGTCDNLHGGHQILSCLCCWHTADDDCKQQAANKAHLKLPMLLPSGPMTKTL